MDLQNMIKEYREAKAQGKPYAPQPKMKIASTTRRFGKVEANAIEIMQDQTFHLTLRTGDVMEVDLERIYNDIDKKRVLDNIKKYKYVSERAEIQDDEKFEPYQDYIFSFHFKLPENFPQIDNRLVIGQRKQSGKNNISPSPIIAQRYRDGKYFITINNSGSKVGKGEENKKIYSTQNNILGQRNEMKYHIRFSDKEDGYLKVWMNGEKIIDQEGIQLYIKDVDFENTFYFKFGLYRDNYNFAIKELKKIGKEDKILAIKKAIQEEKNGNPMTIYFKNYIKEKNPIKQSE